MNFACRNVALLLMFIVTGKTGSKGQKLMPGDQVQIEMDSQDIEKLYEPLVSMANIY